MRIAFFTDTFYPRINGVTISIFSFIGNLLNEGHQVLIVCPDYNEEHHSKLNRKTHFEVFEKNGIKVDVLRVGSFSFILSKEDRIVRLSQWKNVKKCVKKFNPDVIHINTEFIIGKYAIKYAKKYNIPTVYTFHTMWEDYFANYAKFLPSRFCRWFGRTVVSFYLKRCNEIIVPTERIKQVSIRYGITKDPVILPTGIPNFFSNASNKLDDTFIKKVDDLFENGRKKNMLIYVGRMAYEKNIPFLFEVLSCVKKTNPDTSLLLVGGGPELEHLKELASKHPEKDDICFAGLQERSDLPMFYKYGDIFVFPSVTETQGLVTLEAMMSGIPVVAIGELGTADVMQGDNGGFMVSNNVKEFSDKVCMLLNDESLRTKKAKEAVELSSQWSLDSLTPKLVAVYESAIKSIVK